jgi:hypothetical protein
VQFFFGGKCTVAMPNEHDFHPVGGGFERFLDPWICFASVRVADDQLRHFVAGAVGQESQRHVDHDEALGL